MGLRVDGVQELLEGVTREDARETFVGLVNNCGLGVQGGPQQLLTHTALLALCFIFAL